MKSFNRNALCILLHRYIHLHCLPSSEKLNFIMNNNVKAMDGTWGSMRTWRSPGYRLTDILARGNTILGDVYILVTRWDGSIKMSMLNHLARSHHGSCCGGIRREGCYRGDHPAGR